MRVLVTGAAGRVGQTVARVLHDAGVELRLTDRHPLGGLPGPLIVADLRIPEVAHGLVNGVDAVIHLANHPGFRRLAPETGLNENVLLTTNVAAACVAQSVGHLIWASSIQVIHGYPAADGSIPFQQPSLPLDQDALAMPANPYSCSKLLGEQALAWYARCHGLAVCALRLPLMVTSEPVPAFTWESAASVSMNEGFAWLHARAAGSLCLALLRQRLAGYRVYMPAARRPYSCLSVGDLLRRHYQQVPWLGASPPASLICTRRLESDTGWAPAE